MGDYPGCRPSLAKDASLEIPIYSIRELNEQHEGGNLAGIAASKTNLTTYPVTGPIPTAPK